MSEFRSKCCGVSVMNFFQANALHMANGNDPMWYSADKHWFCRKCCEPTQLEKKEDDK